MIQPPADEAFPVSASPEDAKTWIVGQVARITRVDPGAVDTRESLAALGIDSVTAVTLTYDLEAYIGRPVSPSLLADCDSIDEVVSSLFGESDQASAPTPPVIRDARAWLPSLTARVNELKARNQFLYEPVITDVDGVWATVDGRRLLMMSSYSYLGLLGHPSISAAAVAAAERFGTGTHGVRLSGGTLELHSELETRIASFKNCNAAVVFSSGYITNVAAITALVGQGDWVIGDALNHASIIDACTYSGARFSSFPHADLTAAEALMKRAAGARTLVVVDAVFSMDGDIADLPTLSELCRKHGALLMVDEAHSFGVLGKTGRGVVEHFDLSSSAVDIHMGTLSKTIPSVGGYIAGNRDLVDAVKYNARGWIFSAALPPPQAAAAKAAIAVIDSEPERVQRLRENTAAYRGALRQAGFVIRDDETPIVAIACPDEHRTFEFTRACSAEGLLVYPIVYPAVPVDQPRIRTTVTAAHTTADIAFAVTALTTAARRTGILR